MYEKNKNKRRFYKDFKCSTLFYRLIIPTNSAYELSVARRKYCSGAVILSRHTMDDSRIQLILHVQNPTLRTDYGEKLYLRGEK